MTVGTSSGSLAIYRGDKLTQPWGFIEPSGRVVDDLVLTASSTAATSATAVFTTGDTGKKLTVVDGTGLADGVTMTYVSATQVTLSVAATASRTNVVALIRALDLSAYSSHLVHFREQEDSTVVNAATVTSTRGAAGVCEFVLTAAVTTLMPRGGSWDWAATHSTYGDTTLVKSRRWTLVKDTTHA